MTRMDSSPSTRRRGAVVVLVAVTLVTLLLCATMAVDVGYICALSAEQQSNADAGALAGAGALYDGDLLTPKQRAYEVIGYNQKRQGYLSLEDQVVEIGWWHPVDNVFTALPDPADWSTRGYAVRVRAYRNDAPLFFARIIGKNSTDVSREAVTVGGELCKGIWGVQGVRIPGNVYTDSYDSTAGLYDPTTAGSQGDVCSGRGIDGMGSVEVHGDMMTGLGYWPTLAGVAAEDTFPTGITTSSVDGMIGPYVEVPDGLVSGGDLNVNAFNNVDLAPGTYLYDSITMRAGASITVSGPTTIYVASLSSIEGSLDIDINASDVTATGRGFINTTQDPHNLTIVIMGDEAILNGTEAFYGSVIAPNAELNLSGTSDFYGAAMANTVLMRGDFQAHIDESLPVYDLLKAPRPFLVQ